MRFDRGGTSANCILLAAANCSFAACWRGGSQKAGSSPCRLCNIAKLPILLLGMVTIRIYAAGKVANSIVSLALSN